MSRKKYRLKKIEGNFFDLSERKIELNIPVTIPNMDFKEAANISSDDLNAILVRIQGRDRNCTPNVPSVHSISQTLFFDDYNIIDQRLENDPLLAVIIFNNDTPFEVDLPYFEEVVKNSSDVSELINEIRDDNLCNKKDKPFQPREQDGDVIGGNQ